MGNPFPYPLCDRVVTVYRREKDGVLRRVVAGCYYHYQDVCTTDGQGTQFVRKFLLIQPGEDRIYPGDRIYDGEGPEVTAADWDSFLPVTVAGLSQVAYAAPWYWEGRLCHTEAGRK